MQIRLPCKLTNFIHDKFIVFNLKLVIIIIKYAAYDWRLGLAISEHIVCQITSDA